jgi:protein-disulfide isomerase
LWGLAWFLLVLAVQASSFGAGTEFQGRARSHVFSLGIIGMALVFLAAYRILAARGRPSVEDQVAAVCVLAIFVSSSLPGQVPIRTVLTHAGKDLMRLLARAPLWIAACLFIAVAAMRPSPTSAIPTGPAFIQWYSLQPRVAVPATKGGAAVLVIKAIDYECGPCAAAEAAYRPTVEKMRRDYGDAVRFVALDYPLDKECNPYVAMTVHESACEAAAAVRLARERGREVQMVQWLWEHQSRLSPASVFKAAYDIGGVDRVSERYRAAIEGVRADIEMAHELGVPGTPTYIINGVRLPTIPKRDFEAAIVYEMERARALGRGSSSEDDRGARGARRGPAPERP